MVEDFKKMTMANYLYDLTQDPKSWLHMAEKINKAEDARTEDLQKLSQALGTFRTKMRSDNLSLKDLAQLKSSLTDYKKKYWPKLK